MNDKKKKRLDEVKKYLANLENKNDITEGDIDELSNLLDEAVNGTKGEKIIKNIVLFLIRFLALFITSSLILGIMFNELTLERNYYIFNLAVVTAGVLDIIDFIPFFSNRGFSMVYILLIIISAMIGILINDFIPIFRLSSMWGIYIILVEALFNFARFVIAKQILNKYM